MMFAAMHTEAFHPDGPNKTISMLYTLIAISFISTISLLGLDAFRERIVQSNLRQHYRKLVQVAFVTAIASIVLTSAIGFIYKGGANVEAQHLAEK